MLRLAMKSPGAVLETTGAKLACECMHKQWYSVRRAGGVRRIGSPSDANIIKLQRADGSNPGRFSIRVGAHVPSVAPRDGTRGAST